jgi:hypothetical protein
LGSGTQENEGKKQNRISPFLLSIKRPPSCSSNQARSFLLGLSVFMPVPMSGFQALLKPGQVILEKEKW